ncbi:MAG: DegV family protein [Bacilli bacterium]
MKKNLILVDSGSNLHNGESILTSADTDIRVVPFYIRFGEKEFSDDENLDVDSFLEEYHDLPRTVKTSTACPSPALFLKEMEGYQNVVIITISEKLSGAFNAANIAKSMFEVPDNVLVVDSKGAAGMEELVARKTFSLFEEGVSMENMEKELSAYIPSLSILFVLRRFDTLVRAGRVSKIVGLLVTRLHIKPVFYGKDGRISQLEKISPLEGPIKRLVKNIARLAGDVKDKICLITHTKNKEEAEELKKEILETVPFKEVDIRENRGLCSYYSMDKALLVSF